VEPPAPWPGAPRYWPGAPFPPYRHVPGVTPHPERHPLGHSHGRPAIRALALTRTNWRKNFHYLLGADLYHASFFWEAHETWETLWKASSKDSRAVALLKGLIQNAAALLKIHQGNFSGAASLSRRARGYLASIGAGTVFGLDVDRFLRAMDRCFAPLEDLPALVADQFFRRAPRIWLR
jgi:hypothetical protein